MLGWSDHRRFGARLLIGAGRSPGFSASIAYSDQQERILLILSNDPYIGDLGYHFLHRNFPLPDLKKTIYIPEVALKKYEGIYQSIIGEILIETKITVEGASCLRLEPKGEQAAFLYPYSEDCFFDKAVANQTESFHFTTDDNKITGFIVKNNQELSF